MSSFNVYLKKNFDPVTKLNNMTSFITLHYVIVSFQLCPEVGDDNYIALCIFGGRSSVAWAVLKL